MSNPHPYDRSMKDVLKEDADEIVPQFLPGATFRKVLDNEILPTSMRADRVYEISYRGETHILNLEFQAGADPMMAERLLVYASNLHYTYHHPVISLVVYLFTLPTVPISPFKMLSGTHELLTFSYLVVPLWEVDARPYVERRAFSMYPLLPMMKYISVPMLLGAIEDLVEYHKDDEHTLTRRLLWFRIFLKRATVLTPEERQEVEERLDIFEQLLEESDIVQKQRALGLQEGLAKGLAKGREEGEAKGREEGEVKNSQQILHVWLEAHHPELAKRFQARIVQTRSVDVLREVITRLFKNPDEQAASQVLDSLLAEL